MNKFAKLLNKVSFFEELIGLSINKFAQSKVDLIGPLEENAPPFKTYSPISSPPPPGYDVSKRVNAPKGEDPGLFMSPEAIGKGLSEMMQPKAVHGPGFTGGYSPVDEATKKQIEKAKGLPAKPLMDVKKLQKALNDLLMDESNRAAFISEYGSAPYIGLYLPLEVDGVIGKQTRLAMDSAKQFLKIQDKSDSYLYKFLVK